MEIVERHEGDVVILDLEGEMLVGEADELLREKISSLLDAGHRRIALNLMNVRYADSASLGELVRCYATVANHGGELRLLNLGQRFRKLLSFSDDDDWPTGASGATSLGAILNTKPPT